MTEASSKTITFISQQSPYSNGRAQLCLDMVLACAVFEQNIQYVFRGDGVYQLVSGQNGKVIGSKTINKTLETLPLYGVSTISICEKSLTLRGLSINDLETGEGLVVDLVEEESIAKLLSSSNTVFCL